MLLVDRESLNSLLLWIREERKVELRVITFSDGNPALLGFFPVNPSIGGDMGAFNFGVLQIRGEDEIQNPKD